MKLINLGGRILFSIVFFISGISHFSAETIAYAASTGVFMASVLVPASGIIAILGALSIMIGYKAQIGALLLILFLVPITIAMHAFWNIDDPMTRQLNMIMFLKNMSMLGGAMLLLVYGSGPYSLDAGKMLAPFR